MNQEIKVPSIQCRPILILISYLNLTIQIICCGERRRPYVALCLKTVATRKSLTSALIPTEESPCLYLGFLTAFLKKS